ncbi:hypothetical protein EVAR_34743_1 [Eumeta japonica]|uniref:Uncharacterized protein n=1 Tax=Eumeta variegata TaxID=151549 RepID=A0A4C1YLW1_EUMVA|nr:hypothetical protein EVAR_34743_1 [Eumeta japonica]
MTLCRVPSEPSARARAWDERSLFHSIGPFVRVEERQRPHTTYRAQADLLGGKLLGGRRDGAWASHVTAVTSPDVIQHAPAALTGAYRYRIASKENNSDNGKTNTNRSVPRRVRSPASPYLVLTSAPTAGPPFSSSGTRCFPRVARRTEKDTVVTHSNLFSLSFFHPTKVPNESEFVVPVNVQNEFPRRPPWHLLHAPPGVLALRAWAADARAGAGLGARNEPSARINVKYCTGDVRIEK